jgi:hypothetical protein
MAPDCRRQSVLVLIPARIHGWRVWQISRSPQLLSEVCVFLHSGCNQNCGQESLVF